ncbi:class E sortase [Streptomyces sp. ME02-6991-2A]|uniref:class E sortase n=1 Tax=Streptomyces sp. ME02-6991-2A TaxID=3028677 RepID=UPI00100814A1|nr:class E sortase [Streptomyces sp. ME02-6991-2A]MDX3377614.1 class E sortase [Streptomyces sp. ME02-6991-2A]
MTTPRPEDDTGLHGPYAQGAYGADGAFVAAVDGLADPLNDPLPDPLNDPLQDPSAGQHSSPWFRSETAQEDQYGGRQDAAPVGGAAPPAYGGPQQPQGAPSEWYDPEGYQRDWYGSQQAPAPSPAPAPVPPPVPSPAVAPADETLGLRTADTRRIVAEPYERPGRSERPEPAEAFEPPEPSERFDPAGRSEQAEPVTGGRAERRRAAKGRGNRRPAPASATSSAPMSRMEARRAAKAAKDSPAVVASRAVGEVFISLGVLMLLFVTYQLWWTNVRAEQIAGKETDKIQEEWANGAGKPGVFAPGQGFAIMHIPKLDVVVPVAEGINKEKVLDRGMLGHYGEGKLKTAMPEDEQGNFAVAGHRNTHGEPFRYVNKLSPGDPIVVETRDAYYTYEMTSVLPQTSPSNISVIEPIPVGSGFTEPGRYITLTTCTPEFTSTYRLIVWGKMVDERPRSEGKPKALVG